jgi:hypothetical protein
MPKGKVLHHQRVIGRIFRAAEAAHFPVEHIEFCADGTIIVKPTRPDKLGDAPETKNDERRWDKAIHAAHEKRTA